MSPLTKAELTALMGQTVGSLKPYQLEQIQDALNRRYWPQTDAATQSTLTTIAAGWQD